MTARICSPMEVPPGSRVGKTVYPLSRRNSTSGGMCEVFPEPSGPSRVMNMMLPHHQVSARHQQKQARCPPAIELADRNAKKAEVVHQDAHGKLADNDQRQCGRCTQARHCMVDRQIQDDAKAARK